VCVFSYDILLQCHVADLWFCSSFVVRAEAWEEGFVGCHASMANVGKWPFKTIRCDSVIIMGQLHSGWHSHQCTAQEDSTVQVELAGAVGSPQPRTEDSLIQSMHIYAVISHQPQQSILDLKLRWIMMDLKWSNMLKHCPWFPSLRWPGVMSSVPPFFPGMIREAYTYLVGSMVFLALGTGGLDHSTAVVLVSA